MKKTINVADFFQGMEEIYDSKRATSFSITQSYNNINTSAQRVWLKKFMFSEWKEKFSNSGLFLTEVSFNEDKNDVTDFLLRVEAVALGGHKFIDKKGPQELFSVIGSELRKQLAKWVLKNYPFPSDNDILFSAGVPIAILLAGEGIQWGEGEYTDEVVASWEDNTKQFLSKYDVKFLAFERIGYWTVSEIDYNMLLKIELGKDMYIKEFTELLKFLKQIFPKCVKPTLHWLNGRVMFVF